ncbi:hypothetical protein B566_EDAN015954, partial [Ephemera danica]
MVLHVSCAGCASSTTGDATLWLVAMIILVNSSRFPHFCSTSSSLEHMH